MQEIQGLPLVEGDQSLSCPMIINQKTHCSSKESFLLEARYKAVELIIIWISRVVWGIFIIRRIVSLRIIVRQLQGILISRLWSCVKMMILLWLGAMEYGRDTRNRGRGSLIWLEKRGWRGNRLRLFWRKCWMDSWVEILKKSSLDVITWVLFSLS